MVRRQGAERPRGLDPGNLERRIKLENLEQFVGRIVVPVEKITEVRDGKRRIKKVKKFPGYLFCEVEFNEHVLYLFRETSGVGDFVGGSLTKVPQPMTDREVQRMLADQDELARTASRSRRTRRSCPRARAASSSTTMSAMRSRSARACSPTWKARSRTSPTVTARRRRSRWC